ncbi:MAG: hypothetical protein E6772_08410 [Dysgonomonas sp.]|nr:hypothetical protein [Dysgonomonas sp.]
MTEKHEKLLSELDFRMRQLIYLCDSLKEENQELKLRLEEKNQQVLNIRADMEQLNLKYNNLKFAQTLTGKNAEDVETTKKRLSKLVQDVEKCISLLKI